MTIRLTEAMKNQALVNIGTAGHVAHGKSTLVKRLTGQATQRFQSEKHKNITIKLGYANTYLYWNPETQDVVSIPVKEHVRGINLPGYELLYHVSFVDCPGHEHYMATMICGAGIMDHVYVVVAADEQIPQPQTHDHLVALDYSCMEPENMTFLLNKLDLIPMSKRNHVAAQLQQYKEEYDHNNMTIPVSAAMGYNVDSVVNNLAQVASNHMETVVERASQPLRMNIVRSYDINKPGTAVDDFQGGVVGGAIVTGVLTVGDMVELRPGVINMVKGKRVVQPLVAKVMSMRSDTCPLETALPGGLVGVNLSIYSGLTSQDKMKGQVLTHLGEAPGIYNTLSGKFRTFHETRLLKQATYNFIVNGITNVTGTISELEYKRSTHGTMTIVLNQPVCVDLQDARLAILVKSKLVASFKVTNGRCSYEISYPPGTPEAFEPPSYEVVNDTNKFYAKVEPPELDPMTIPCMQAQTVKLQVPLLESSIMNRNTIIDGSNLRSFLGCMHRGGSLEDLEKAVVGMIETGLVNSKPRFNQHGNLVLNGRFSASKLNGFIQPAMKKYLTCTCCRSMDTYVEKKTRFCKTCKTESRLA